MQATPPTKSRWSRNGWFYVALVLGIFLFFTCIALGAELEDAPPTPTPAAASPAPTTPPVEPSPVPTPTTPPVDPSPTPAVNPIVDSFTGQELFDCLTDPATPVEERLDCQSAQEYSAIEAVSRTGAFADIPTREQLELQLAVEQADALFEEIGETLRNPDGFRAYCAGGLEVDVAQAKTLYEYSVTVDPPLLYLDYKIVAISEFLSDLATTCP